MSELTRSDESFQVLFYYVISFLNDHKIRYAILRDYEDLPNARINDIDFAIDSKENLSLLLEHLLDKGVEITLTKERFGVQMFTFSWMSTAVKYDFWYDINYVGLSYCDLDLLFATSKLEDGKEFRRVSFKSEFFISILKEMLHNKRLRNDKVNRLQQVNCINYEWENVLSQHTSSQLSIMVSENKYETELRLKTLKEIVLNNCRKYKFGVIVRTAHWLLIRLR